MRGFNFLSAVPFVLLNLMSPDAGGGSGGASDAPNPTEENEPQPTGETIEAKLTSAKTIIGQLFSKAKQVVGLTKERDDAKSESTRLQGLLDATTLEATNAKGEVTRLTNDLSVMTTDRNNEKTRADKAASDVTRLETLCGLRGIDSKKAVPPAIESASSGANAELKSQYADLVAQEKEGKIEPGSSFNFFQKHKDKL